MCQMRFLGDFEIELDGHEPTGARMKVAEILFVLAEAQGSLVSRREVARHVWGNSGSAALEGLRQHLVHLQRTLGEQKGRLIRDPGHGNLALDLTGAQVDFLQFRLAVEEAKRIDHVVALESALQLYTGHLMPKSACSHVRLCRDQFADAFVAASVAAAGRLVSQGAAMRASEVALRAAQICPASEKIVDLALRLTGSKAQRDRIYRAFMRSVGSDTPKADAVRATYNSLTARRRLIDNTPASARFDNIPTNAEPALIGREHLLTSVANTLQETRFVHLTGGPGTGKSRLLQEVGSRYRNRYQNGAIYINAGEIQAMNSLDAESMIVGLIGNAMESSQDAGHSLVALISRLKRLRLLLLFDEADHVAAMLPDFIKRIQDQCSNVSVVAASRVGLKIDYGAVIKVPRLAIPDPTCTRIRDLLAFPAARLFDAVARARNADYQQIDSNASIIAQIVAATQGVPLDLIIAASARWHSLGELLIHLEAGRKLLSVAELVGDGPLGQARARTLETGFRLLSVEEQRLLAGASVFEGEFGKEAAAALVADDGEQRVSADDLLDRLVIRSFVERREQSGKSRYFLLGLVKDYAARHMLELGDEISVRARLSDHYLERVEDLTKKVDGAGLANRIDSLYLDRANVSAAAEFCVRIGDIEKALNLITGMVRVFYSTGQISEGDVYIQRVVELSESVPPGIRRKSLHGVALIAYLRNRYDLAEKYWNLCSDISRMQKEPASELQDEGNLGLVARARKQLDAAEELFTRCLDGYRARGNRRAEARSLGNLALVAEDKEQYTRAIDLYTQSVAIFRDLQDPYSISLALCNLGCIYTRAGMFSKAHRSLGEALEISFERKDSATQTLSIDGYFKLAAAQGDPERASILLGAWAAAQKRNGNDAAEFADDVHRSSEETVMESLGKDEFDARFLSGSTAGPEWVYQFARFNVALLVD